ncbi:hypothetical protein [Paenibacillus pinihumi]|uniref:hypothetical protein n=1 Tax=Paenibacillus pinihumi TaxID=669462 RepID=UPI00041C9368|nr:hypothetical protein [Paenibacillus pinihumi]
MKKKMVLLGAVLAISAVTAQAAFAAPNNGASTVKPSLEAVKGQPDFSNVKEGTFTIIGPVSGDFKGKGTTGAANGSEATLQETDAKPDLSKVKEGKAVAVGKVKGKLNGNGKTLPAPAKDGDKGTASLQVAEVQPDFSKSFDNIKEGKLEIVGKVSGSFQGTTTAKK